MFVSIYLNVSCYITVSQLSLLQLNLKHHIANVGACNCSLFLSLYLWYGIFCLCRTHAPTSLLSVVQLDSG